MKLFLFLIFIISSFSYSQSNTLTRNFQNMNFNTTINYKPFVWRSSFKNQNTYLTTYNSTTGINNKYTIVGETYFLSNTMSFSTLNAFDLNRIDSFNPNGTKNFGSALIFGVLNLILKKN